MGVTGGVKFFTKSKALFSEGATATASTNPASAKYVLDTNKYTIWESIGSNDITTETLTIIFSKDKTIDRILLVGMNFKKFQVKYDVTGAWTDFTSVIGVNGVTNTKIDETAWIYDSAYYEFDSVTTGSIQITIDTTQVVDAEKEIQACFPTSELGTFIGFPTVGKVKHDPNIRKAKAVSGRFIVQKSFEIHSMSIKFKSYPVQADLDLVATLLERDESFLVYLCGGRVGTMYFKYAIKGWKLSDVYNMQVIKAIIFDYEQGIYINGVKSQMDLVEVV